MTRALAALLLGGALLGGAPFALAAGAEPFPVERPLAFRLAAADGMPGAVHVDISFPRAGTWRARARWTGRGMAGLWLQTPDARPIDKRVGAAPLEIEIVVADDGRVRPGQPLRLRFAPLTHRGVLEGELALEQPPPPTPPPVLAFVSPVAPVESVPGGPGACLLAPTLPESGVRALRPLAEALEAAGPEDVAWARQWASTLREEAARERSESARRNALGTLWERLRRNPAPSPALDAAVRRVLAGVDESSRRGAVAERDAILGALACL